MAAGKKKSPIENPVRMENSKTRTAHTQTPTRILALDRMTANPDRTTGRRAKPITAPPVASINEEQTACSAECPPGIGVLTRTPLTAQGAKSKNPAASRESTKLRAAPILAGLFKRHAAGSMQGWSNELNAEPLCRGSEVLGLLRRRGIRRWRQFIPLGNSGEGSYEPLKVTMRSDGDPACA